MHIFSRRSCVLLLLLSVIFVGFSFFTSSPTESRATSHVLSYYKSYLDSLNHSISTFATEAPHAGAQHLRTLFSEARLHYKKIEFIVEYHYPASALKLNGAALLESEANEPNEPQHPSGFQVLEETVFDELNEDARKQIIFELSNISNSIHRLYTQLPQLELTETNVLDALRLNLYRLITKGITGFDSPVALNSIAEAEATLVSTRCIVSFFTNAKSVAGSIDGCVDYIRQSGYEFNGFNRAVFIQRYINSVCRLLHMWQTTQKIPFEKQSRAFAVTAETLFDKNGFDPLFYAPSGTEAASDGQIALGKQLFGDPLLSANGKRSCNSCHIPEKAFTDGLALNAALSGDKKLLRNTPTLLNAALQPVQFYDSHIAFLEDQAHDVISNRQEMGGLFESITEHLQKKPNYKNQFALHYADHDISAANVKAALAAYVRSLVNMNSRFDRYMRGENSALSATELKGFNLFMGKARCGTCHFMPLFSGAVPPLFDKMESEVLGVPANRDTLHPIQDLDSGKYHLYGIPHQLYSFKTSTVRNAALTPPYMHNGVFNTLEQVMDFYNMGGGAGLGFDLPNQTLSTDRLNLDEPEKKQVIAFIKALSSR